ncbi:MAG: M6 family metalloprotease domain-containing protein [Bacteroidales bacterium]|jgi:M6 family metalloprotease-like protein|nr:M6 family metalloprotease domain-containing protein [Bacteroidales bacterium]
MKNKFLNLLLLGAMLFTQTMFAVPAKQGVISITQQDGTNIDVYITGDERISWYKTTDGYTLLVNSQGILEYAVLDNQNNLVPSGIKARNVDERSLADISFLSGLKTHLDYSNAQKKQLHEIAKEMFDFDDNRNKSQGIEGVTVGRRKALIILVAYQDVPFTYSREQFDNLFNQVNYNVGGAAGSVRDYFLASSFGKLELEPTIVGPYTLPNNRAYYGAHTSNGGNDQNARQMIIDACSAADFEVDFSQFDGNGDTYVDGVHVIFAGLGEASGGPAESIWPHRGELITPIQYDGVKVRDYSCSAEKRSNNQIAGIGTIAHELGHVLGLPDYYDVDYSGTKTIGSFDIMDNGSYNNNENNPPLYCAYSRMALGWVEPYVLESDMNMDITSLPIWDSNEIFLIKTSTDKDYFLFENKQLNNIWDNYIYGDGGIAMSYPGGLLLTHVNQSQVNWGLLLEGFGNRVNTNPLCPGFRVVRADNIESGYTNSSGVFTSTNVHTDVYPGYNNISDFWANNGAEPTGENHSILDALAHVHNIVRLSNGNITFKVGQGSEYANETVTSPATNIQNTSATLNGNVIINSVSGSIPTEQGFVYSSLPYPTINQTSTCIKVPITNPTNMTYDLTSLNEGERYYYRAYSINAEGTTYGSQETFLTLSPAISNNFIVDSNFAACITGEVPTIIASTPQGGNGSFRYNWLQSEDNITYTHTVNVGNRKDYTPGRMVTPLYFKRIVTSGDKVDTSIAKYVPIVDSTVAGHLETANTEITLGETAIINVIDNIGSVMFWQRKYNTSSWQNLTSSIGVTSYHDTPNAIGDYLYRVSIQNGACPSKLTPTINLKVTNDVSIVDIDNISVFNIYPNPANSEFTLMLNKQYDVVNLNIIDMLGRVIYEAKNVKNGQKIDISELKQGTFFVVVKVNDAIIEKRQLIHKK